MLSFIPCYAGCGAGGDRVAVEGIITLDGQPMPGVYVTFDQPELSPNENIGYVGRTDAEGRYSLRPMIGDGSGAPPGKYRVSLTTAVLDATQPAPAPSPQRTTATPFYPEPQPPPEKIPRAYRGGKLTFEVPADGTEEANFELKSR
ncbi:MAG TPA: carboxypeptidase-like regulatory domain-containing protein [Lacipirellulaceae bacterium]|jgi:hypothetical protein|nr:carboxypeptidase-like regulatory domain-containing protein [Lacipirellulaceae bacterium]